MFLMQTILPMLVHLAVKIHLSHIWQIRTALLMLSLTAGRAALRLITFCKAGGRILTDGGMTATLGVAVTPELKIQAVCAALARFHRRNCSDDGKHIQVELLTEWVAGLPVLYPFLI